MEFLRTFVHPYLRVSIQSIIGLLGTLGLYAMGAAYCYFSFKKILIFFSMDKLQI